MTTPDAGQRLIEDLRDLHTAFDGTMSEEGRETLLAAAAELERLRGVEALTDRLADGIAHMSWCRTCAEDGEDRCDLGGKDAKQALDDYQAIAASRSTGAADVGEEHG